MIVNLESSGGGLPDDGSEGSDEMNRSLENSLLRGMKSGVNYSVKELMEDTGGMDLYEALLRLRDKEMVNIGEGKYSLME